MTSHSSDRNLLFGILALQMDFISRDALIKAMNAWVLEKSKSLGQILTEQGALAVDLCDFVEAMIDKHLQAHDNDPHKSLAAVSSADLIYQEMKQIADPDFQATLAYLSAAADDHLSTGFDDIVGTATSAGTRFRILRPHARGGLGEVFVAHDEELHREVALKEIQERHGDNPESRARFVREAEITGGLEHPGIVPVYGLGSYADGRPFYAMRFIRGDSLKEAIERFHKNVGCVAGPKRGQAADPPIQGTGNAPYSGERVVEFHKLLGRFIDVCNAIAYAHSRGVLHRDLKPGNIMLGKYGETLVVDWGLAKSGVKCGESGVLTPGGEEAILRPASASGSAETQAGKAMGTPAFMSPEQAAGRLDLLDPASDVYSLGATLYCLLTGRAPFGDPDKAVVLHQVQRGEFRRPRLVNAQVPSALEAVCLKAMALKQDRRYASPRALADDIEHWLADEPVSAWPEPWTVKTGRWMRRNKSLVSGAAAAVLVGLIALTGGTIWYQGHQAEAARKLALTEQKVRQGVDQAIQTRDKLHAELKKPGGVQELLNQRAVWQARINSARADWKRAKALAVNAEEGLDPALTELLQKLDTELNRDQADYDLALRLEKIRLDTAVLVEGKFNTALAEREYPRAFGEAGLGFEPGRQKETARRIQQSAIKDQLLGAMDDWARVALRRKNPELCRRLLETARLADPDPWRDQVRDLALWRNPAAVGQLADAVQADQETLARLSPQMLHLIFTLLPEAKEEPWLRKAQAVHPADFWLNFELGVVLEKTKKRGLEPVGFLLEALAIRPKTTAVYDYLGFVLLNQKDLPAAIDIYKKTLALDAKNAMSWNNLGSALEKQKDLPGALDAYKKALAVDAKNVLAWSNLGSALEKQKDLPGAIDAYKKALAIDAKNAMVWNNLGIALKGQKNLPAAIDAHKKALAIDAKYAAAWTSLGIALWEQKDLPAAIDAYKKALAVDDKLAPAWNNLGVALNDQKNLPAAVDAYKKALAIDAKFAFAWYNLGRALDGQKDLPGAIDAYKKALAVDDKLASVWHSLGIALYAHKDLPAAIDACKKAIFLEPDFAEAHSMLGFALRDQGDFTAACQALEKGHRLRSVRKDWAIRSEAWVKHCRQLLALDEKLPGVLRGDAVSAGELLSLADMCQLYKKRYADAATLFAKAFTAEPQWAEDLIRGHRYKAACVAALASAGKGFGAEKLQAKEKTGLRQQASIWLQADLAARSGLLEKNPVSAVQIKDDLEHWQVDPDLAGVRDEKELGKLSKEERAARQKLWAEVEVLSKKARASYTQTDHKGQLSAKMGEQRHPIRMRAGKTYMIDMASPQFDTYLRLEDDKGKVLAENDDISPQNLNSRIIFTAQKDGGYRIVATSFEQRGIGAYTITIREFTSPKKPKEK